MRLIVYECADNGEQEACFLEEDGSKATAYCASAPPPPGYEHRPGRYFHEHHAGVMGESPAPPSARLKTPQTDPEHHTVGQYFMGSGGERYYCDSYDPACGYWMTPCGKPGALDKYGVPLRRRNVSERAIDRTYWTIYSDDAGREWCTVGWLQALREWSAAHPDFRAHRPPRAMDWALMAARAPGERASVAPERA